MAGEWFRVLAVRDSESGHGYTARAAEVRRCERILWVENGDRTAGDTVILVFDTGDRLEVAGTLNDWETFFSV